LAQAILAQAWSFIAEVVPRKRCSPSRAPVVGMGVLPNGGLVLLLALRGADAAHCPRLCHGFWWSDCKCDDHGAWAMWVCKHKQGRRQSWPYFCSQPSCRCQGGSGNRPWALSADMLENTTLLEAFPANLTELEEREEHVEHVEAPATAQASSSEASVQRLAPVETEHGAANHGVDVVDLDDLDEESGEESEEEGDARSAPKSLRGSNGTRAQWDGRRRRDEWFGRRRHDGRRRRQDWDGRRRRQDWGWGSAARGNHP